MSLKERAQAASRDQEMTFNKSGKAANADLDMVLTNKKPKTLLTLADLPETDMKFPEPTPP